MANEKNDLIKRGILAAFEQARKDSTVKTVTRGDRMFLTVAQIAKLSGVSASAVAARLHSMLLNPFVSDMLIEGIEFGRSRGTMGAWGPMHVAPEVCGATLVLDGSDPVSSGCDLEPKHEGVKHEGPCPYGTDGRVRWEGGGMCAGDPLPVRNVEFPR